MALKWLFDGTSKGVEFVKNGKIDFVYIFYAGYGEAESGIANTIWPQSYELSLNYYKSHDTIRLDGKVLDNYACSQELLYATRKHDGIGTFCHEFSHVLGLPDYYDTQYGENFSTYYNTPKNWHVMAHGMYNNGGETPPNFCAFDKYFLGWLTPQSLNEEADAQLTTDYDDVYQISRSGNLQNSTCADTIYYLENRQLSGWDAFVPGHGMMVWQVVYDAKIWDNNSVNDTPKKPRFTFIPADGNYINATSEPRSGGDGDNGDPFPGIAQQSTFAPFANCTLTNIQESAEGTISFHFSGIVSDKLENTAKQPAQVTKIIHNGEILIIRNGIIYNTLGQEIK